MFYKDFMVHNPSTTWKWFGETHIQNNELGCIVPLVRLAIKVYHDLQIEKLECPNDVLGV
jgi:hypothetical protein